MRVSDLASVAAADRADGNQRRIEIDSAIYQYVAASAVADADGPAPIAVDTDGVIIPNDNPGTGRWIKQNAYNIPVADAAGRYTSTDVEGALAEIAGSGRTTETVKDTFDRLEDVFTWVANGTLSTGTALDGGRIAIKSGTVTAVTMFLEDRGGAGGAGSTIADVNLHVPAKPITTARFATEGTTIFSTQGNRPALAGAGGATDNGVIQTAAPNVTAFAAGDFFTMDIDQVTTTASVGLVICVYVKYNAS